MFIKNYEAALAVAEANVRQYMVNDVIEDDEGFLLEFLPLIRSTLAIKFAERDPSLAEMAASALGMVEHYCTSAEAYNFYVKLMGSPDLFSRVMEFVDMAVLTPYIDGALGTLDLSEGVGKRHAKLLQDVREIGAKFGFYDADNKAYSGGITRTEHLNGMTKELMLPPELVMLLMGYYIHGQRVRALISDWV